MNNNLLLEVKQLHKTFCQLLFESNKNNLLTKHPSPLQIRVIKYLIEHKKDIIYQKDLQISLDVSKAAISDTLQSMERKEIIKRLPSKEDGRKIQITLTEKGLKTFDDMEDDMIKVNQIIKNSITKEEYEEFIRISHKIKESIKKEGRE